MASPPTRTTVNGLSRAQAMDVSIIDHELLKLLLPQIRSMFKYFDDSLFNKYLNVDAISDQYEYPSLMTIDQQQRRHQIQNSEHRQHQQQQQQQQRVAQVYDPSSKYFTNIVLYLLKAAMIYSTLLHCDIPTPGMSNLKATFRSSSWEKRLAGYKRKNVFRKKVYHYILLSTFLPLVHEIIKWKATNYQSVLIDNMRDNPSDTNYSERNSFRQRSSNDNNRTHEIIRTRRRLAVLQFILKISSIVIPPIQIYAHIIHLIGNTASPDLSMKLSNLQYDALPQEKSGQRSVNFSYAQRRLWYEEAMLTFGMIVPMDVWREVPNIARAYVSRFQEYTAYLVNCFRKDLLHRNGSVKSQCPICLSEPIAIPYITSCGHTYCYPCLRNAVTDASDSKYRCRVCRRIVSDSRPSSP